MALQKYSGVLRLTYGQGSAEIVTDSQDACAEGPDLSRLRSERLARLQEAMRAHGTDACLLFNEPNIRYATGATAMPVYSMSTFVRCAVVAQEGDPILFEHANSVHRSRLVTSDVRPMHAWEFFDDPLTQARTWVAHVRDALRDRGVADKTVAVDRLGTPGFLALLEDGFTISDSSAVLMDAREIKTPEEIRALELNSSLIMRMLSAVDRALEPGVRERDLLGLMADSMLRGGGEYLATSTVCSGPNTNPWRAEATDRAVEAGDLVFVDTDTVGIEGYFFCVSRTFLCGDVAPTRRQRDLYRSAHDWLVRMLDLIEPGVTCGELADRAPDLPEGCVDQRYECFVHGAGLEEESPSVCHPRDTQPNPHREVREGMVLVVELYCGEVGGREGVKLGEQIVVTPSGPRILAPYPYAEVLLA
jgi:Xaa-Pro dipeptidase